MSSLSMTEEQKHNSIIPCVKSRPYLSDVFLRRAKGLYFPMCSNGTLTWRTHRTKFTDVCSGLFHWRHWSECLTLFTCDVEILDWSWRAVRSEEETLAGAPRWSRMLTFLSLSAREIARGDVLPKIILCTELTTVLQKPCKMNWSGAGGQWTHRTAGLVRRDWRWPAPARFGLCWQRQRLDLEVGPVTRSPGGLLQSSRLFHHLFFSPVLHPRLFDWRPSGWEWSHYSYGTITISLCVIVL